MSNLNKFTCLMILVSIMLTGCISGQNASPAVASVDVAQAEVLFMVEVPSTETSPGDVILNVLDEVTGLALNPLTYKMQKRDESHFSLKLPVNLGTVLKYRYSRSDAVPIMETAATGSDIRYRMAVVDTPMSIYDTVAAWGDHAYQGETGKITGVVLDITTNTPVPNIMITAGGLTAFSASDGSFIINYLPKGTHNLVAYALDGNYLPFQQGATIETGQTTPAEIRIIPGQPVNLTFLLNVPAEYKDLPVRLAGNISQLGNTFADLSGGTSAVASRMPILAGLEDGRQYVTISVSAGTYIEYKYTLGDGFWNSELNDEGWFNLRGMVVPAADTIVQDDVKTFIAEGTEPITFDVEIPSDTPLDDRVSIQFNPFGWMEPIPMMSAADNHWTFTVYNPINLVGNFTYRYCRNELCGFADDAATAGIDHPGRSLPADGRDIKDKVANWQALDEYAAPEMMDAIIPYGTGEVTGIEISPEYSSDWGPHFAAAIKEIGATGANTIVLTPSWTCPDPATAYCDLSPATTPTWQQTYEQIWQAQQLGLSVFLYPQLRSSIGFDEWWQAAPRNGDWWTRWYIGYKRQMVNYADLAEQAGVKYLIVGGNWATPSLPGGVLSDGSSSGAPADSITYWMDIITAIRSHFSGKLIWEMNYPEDLAPLPPFLSSVDIFYVTIDGPISASAAPSLTELQDGFAGIIDTSVYPLVEQYGKPVYIGIEYPSLVGSAEGCSATVGACGDIDLNIQTEIYRAALTVVNYRDWLSGFISRGFYAPARLTDGSSSVHGKPAEDLLGYWFPHINGPTQ
jgi:hypothetical protein